MYKNVFKVLIGLGLMVGLNSLVVEGAQKGSSGAGVLKLNISPRAAALGEAFCALADDTSAIYYNPAGLVQLKGKEFMLVHNKWLEEINYEFLSYAQPLFEDGALGLAITYLDSGDMEKRDVGGTKEGNFDAKDMVFNLGYGKKISPELSFGAGIKAISLKIDNEDARGFSIDAGFLYRTPIENLSIGGALQNIGKGIKFIKEKDKLPLNIKLGSSYKMQDNRLTLLLDLNKPIDNDLRINIGTEYFLQPNFALRLGYNSGIDEGSGITAGIGFIFKNLQLDYAYVPYSDLGQAHRVSLSIKSL